MADEQPVTMATKLPRALRDDFAALAKRRSMTPSALIRHLIERHLAGAADGEQPGEVEAAVRAELADRGADATSARAAAAVNLARRMDRIPTSGAPNAAQLRVLLGELSPLGETDFDALSWLRLSRAFRIRGWRITDDTGRCFDAVEVVEPERARIVDEVAGR